MVVLCVGCLSQQAQLYMLKWFTVLEGLGLKYEEQPSGCFCSVPLVKALCIKQRILLPKFPQSSSLSSQRQCRTINVALVDVWKIKKSF